MNTFFSMNTIVIDVIILELETVGWLKLVSN